MSQWSLTPSQRASYRSQLAECREARHYRRLLALLEVDRGEWVVTVARRLGVSRQSIHNWMQLAQGVGDLEAWEDRPRSGRPSLWNRQVLRRLAKWLKQSPEELGYYAATWTVPLLREQLRSVCGLIVSDETLRRELRRMGYSWKRSRYVLEADPERERKTSILP